MKKAIKTNAMRILDQARIPYQIFTYPHDTDASFNGVLIAKHLKEPTACVFKTLVTTTVDHRCYVFVIPVEAELDLKKCAAAVKEKRIEMLPMKELQKVCGYIRGGCSPIGMKKSFPTVFHKSALACERIYLSGGRLGYQIAAAPKPLIELLHAKADDIIK